MIKKLLGHVILKVSGWKWEGSNPTVRKFIFIAAPHTTNWDLVHMLALGAVQGIELSWMGKHTLFRGPLGALLRWTNGVPIDRTAPRGIVQQMVDEFGSRENFALAVAASGTRSRRDYWKSGFYWIALGAEIPVVTGYLDYRRKVGGMGPPVMLTGDIQKDMDVFRAFYKDITPKYPAQLTPVRLREEDEVAEPTLEAGAG